MNAPGGSPGGSWPAELMIVRHGESAGNLARDAAEAARLAVIDIALRDMDVPLSPRGEEQARSLGRWLGGLAEGHRPEVVYSSPYVRAESTARLALEAAGLDLPVALDERLRERDFGMLDRLTAVGIREHFPEQAEARARMGKFFYRPPGGESWTDVALRVRSALDSITRQHPGRRVLVVAHEVVVLVFRYVLEELREVEILELGRREPLANCSVTSYAAAPDGAGMRLTRAGSVEPLEALHAPVTREADPAPRAD